MKYPLLHLVVILTFIALVLYSSFKEVTPASVPPVEVDWSQSWEAGSAKTPDLSVMAP